jgi:hypothetical protein
VARIGGAVGAGIVALILFGTTLWFLGDALMLWVEEKGLSAAAAAGLTGLAGLLLTALLGFVAKMLVTPRRRPALPAATAPAGSTGITNGIAADLGALAAQQIVNTTRAHPYSTMGAALAAGVAVGAIPELRRSVVGLFKH